MIYFVVILIVVLSLLMILSFLSTERTSKPIKSKSKEMVWPEKIMKCCFCGLTSGKITKKSFYVSDGEGQSCNKPVEYHQECWDAIDKFLKNHTEDELPHDIQNYVCFVQTIVEEEKESKIRREKHKQAKENWNSIKPTIKIK